MTERQDEAGEAHSILGASSMYRWQACPGSVAQCKGIESTTSDAAALGHLAHSLAERFIRGELGQEFWTLDEETRECITLYHDTLFNDYMDRQWPVKRAIQAKELFIEHRFDLSSVYPGCFGTSDAVMWNPQTRLLRVYDYKHGKSVVEVRNNSQLSYYGLGALVTLKFPAKEVELVIVQPRAKHRDGPVRRWRIPALELLDFEADLIAACKATEAPDAPLNPGRHCFFCPAKPNCPALVRKARDKAAEEFSDLNDDIFS